MKTSKFFISMNKPLPGATVHQRKLDFGLLSVGSVQVMRIMLEIILIEKMLMMLPVWSVVRPYVGLLDRRHHPDRSKSDRPVDRPNFT